MYRWRCWPPPSASPAGRVFALVTGSKALAGGVRVPVEHHTSAYILALGWVGRWKLLWPAVISAAVPIDGIQLIARRQLQSRSRCHGVAAAAVRTANPGGTVGALCPPLPLLAQAEPMGVGWRRFTERLHQGGPLKGRDFEPTSNARCSTMLEEAKQFVGQLKKCERAVRQMAAANADSVGTIKAVMSTPLPLRFEETAAGGGSAMHGAPSIGGEGFRAEAMGRMVQEASHKTEAEVLAPLQRWSDVYSQLGARYSELERVRLEVDSRRRTVLEVSQKVDSLRAQLSSRGSDAKQEAALEQTVRRLQHKEGKLRVAAQSYVDQEQLLHRDLSTLILDARWLKNYAAAALRLQGNALLSAADAFGPLGTPSPPARKVVAAAQPSPLETTMAVKQGIMSGIAADSMGSLFSATSRPDPGSPTTPAQPTVPPLACSPLTGSGGEGAVHIV